MKKKADTKAGVKKTKSLKLNATKPKATAAPSMVEEGTTEAALKVPKKRGPQGPRKPKDPTPASQIHVGEIVNKRMRLCNLNKNRLASVLKLTPPTVSMMINSRSIQTERLMELSFVLKHNFFLEIGQILQLSEAGVKAMEAATINFQQDTDHELKFLREENAYLKKIVEILAAAKN